MDAQLLEVDSLPFNAVTHWIGGTAGVDLGERRCFRCITGAGATWTAAVLFESAGAPFVKSLIWPRADIALIGGGAGVHCLDLRSGSPKTHLSLDSSYFSDMRVSPHRDLLYVASGTEVRAVGDDLKTLWKTSGLAVDGVIFCESDSPLVVHAEMDPPGGWQQVTLDPNNGRELGRRDV